MGIKVVQKIMIKICFLSPPQVVSHMMKDGGAKYLCSRGGPTESKFE